VLPPKQHSKILASINPGYVAAVGAAFQARMFTLHPWLLVEEHHAGDETIMLPKEIEKEEKFRKVWGLPKAECVVNESKRNQEYWRDFSSSGWMFVVILESNKKLR
jgi:hypothetical protein